MEPISIQVVGGSLGGLTAACLLRDDGHDVTIYERSTRELEERGAGIGFLSATAKYLVERAGLDVGEISVATDHIRYLNRDGSIAHDQEHRYYFSSWNTVYRRLLACFDQERYQLSHELVDFEQGDGTVTGVYANGHRATTDLLVAADGIGSLVRARLQPDAQRSFAGYVAWRGMVPESQLPDQIVAELGDAITYCVYANSHILVYPIPNIAGSVAPGDRLVNFVWYRNYLDGGDLADLLTDRDGVTRELSVPPGAMSARHEAEARATAAARLPPVIAAVVEATEDLFIQTIYDIEVDQMAFGRVALLGDAAFSVRPHAAAGTAKAADDGWALAAALQGDGSLDERLAHWEQSQLSLGRSLLARTRDVGSRSQVTSTWIPGDPDLIFGLHRPGD